MTGADARPDTWPDSRADAWADAWADRFRLPAMTLPTWGHAAPDRCVYASDATGVWQVYAWDRAAGRLEDDSMTLNEGDGVLGPHRATATACSMPRGRLALLRAHWTK